ncbi:MAG: hypothetical protein ACYSSP_04525 [Planctomycetota bacterium]|jgi:hypothetical protein
MNKTIIYENLLKKALFSILALTVAAALIFAKSADQHKIKVTPNIKITRIPDKLNVFEKAGFSKYVCVFGIHIFSTSKTPDKKIIHAANVMAQYLDNNEDGIPDNTLVLSHLLSRNAYLVFPADEEDFRTIDPDNWHDAGYHHGQFQHAQETIPEFLNNGIINPEVRYDASLEEILHLVTDHGYGNAYPKIFGRTKGTAIANCLDDARAGHFRKVPTDGPHYGYPKGSWFHYDDRTCNYDCMNSEYIYWALTSILGTQDYPNRTEEIGHEWELNTKELVMIRDPNVYALLTDLKYKFPAKAPDGNYKPSAAPTTIISLVIVDD